MQIVGRNIFVTFQKEGIHFYPAAATDPQLVDVAFLASPHRHMFHFKVLIEVFTDDRDLEFILFKRWLESLFSGGILQLDNKSCEMISDELAEQINTRYPLRNLAITVSEDNENGSFTVYNDHD